MKPVYKKYFWYITAAIVFLNIKSQHYWGLEPWLYFILLAVILLPIIEMGSKAAKEQKRTEQNERDRLAYHRMNKLREKYSQSDEKE